MDELLYLIALAAGSLGAFFIWRYAREQRKKAQQKLGSKE